MAIKTLLVIAIIAIALIIALARAFFREVKKELYPAPPTKEEWKDPNIFL